MTFLLCHDRAEPGIFSGQLTDLMESQHAADPVGDGQYDPDADKIDGQGGGGRKKVTCRQLQKEKGKEDGDAFQPVEQQQHTSCKKGGAGGIGQDRMQGNIGIRSQKGGKHQKDSNQHTNCCTRMLWTIFSHNGLL